MSQEQGRYEFKPRIIRNRNACNAIDSNRPLTADKSASVREQDDLKISKLLRRLNSETNKLSVVLDICNKLKVVLVDQTNVSYVRKSFDILAESVVGALDVAPFGALESVAKVFGLMGFLMKNDFPAYKAWIVKTFKSKKHLKVAMMQSLLETLELDTGRGALHHFSGRLIELLKDFLEGADTASVFLAVMRTIVKLSQNHPKDFAPHFKDVVDICIGWHLETDQSSEVRQQCSKMLQDLQPFWKMDVGFTKSLLGQFLEDIEACKVEEASSIVSFGSYVSALNTVLTCLCPVDDSVMAFDFLNETGTKILTLARAMRRHSVQDDALLPAYECVCLMMKILQSHIEPTFLALIEEFVLDEIHQMDYMNKNTVLYLLEAISQYVAVVKNDLSVEMVNVLLNADSPFVQLKFRNASYHVPLCNIFHSILDIKNVSIMQEAYRHVLIDIQRCFDAITEGKVEIVPISSPVPDYTLQEALISLNFSLACIAKIANASNSIMAMWALQPSILDLLGVRFKLADESVWSTQYAFHNLACLKLLSSHCMRNNNFISSSLLLKSPPDGLKMLSLESSSPTASNFEMILEFLASLTTNVELTGDRLFIFLEWCGSIFAQIASQYVGILTKHRNFVTLVAALTQYSLIHNVKVSLMCAEALQNLSEGANLLPDESLKLLSQVCCLQMCSVSPEIRDRFSHIFAFLPLRITLREVTDFSGINRAQASHIKNLQHWHFSNETHGSLKGQYFRDFIKQIGFDRDHNIIEPLVKDVFTNCWNVGDVTSNAYAEMALKDIRPLITWIQWEAAQYCVNNKLRTTLGKPQDTFLKIESLIKEDARILSLKEQKGVNGLSATIANQKSARVLLGFLESLEKAIHNASDGTAFALPPFDKPAKTFFRLNAPTCNEWFNRIRTAVELVALHSMEAEQVIRYSEAVLKDLAAAGRFEESLFEHTLMSLVWALLRTYESDALHGVYNWVKKITGKKIMWIKMAAEQAAGHREIAGNGYVEVLKTNELEERKLDTQTREFIVDMAVMSLMCSGKWVQTKEFLIEEEARNEPRTTIPVLKITSAMMEACIKYDETKDIKAIDMTCWEYLGEREESLGNFSVHHLICMAENSIGNIILENDPNPEKTSKQIFKIIHNLLHECLRTGNKEYLQQLTIANHLCFKAILGRHEDVSSLYVEKIYGSFNQYRLLYWSEFFNDYTPEGEQQCIDLRLDNVSISRKEKNLFFGEWELEKYYRKCGLGKRWGIQELKISNVRELLLNEQMGNDLELWDANFARATYEHCKLIQCIPEEKQHAVNLAACVTSHLMDKVSLVPDAAISERISRFLLTLSEWVQTSPDHNAPHLLSMMQKIPALAATEYELVSVFSVNEILVGRLLQESARRFPDLAKAWFKVGAWFYRWGRKLVEQKNDQGAKLSTFDIVSIKSVIPNLSDVDTRMIGDIFHQHQASPEEEDICNQLNTTEIIENQLRLVPSLASVPSADIAAIIEVWKQAHKTVYSYYEKAAEAYFKFLQVTCSSEKIEDKMESSLVNATLRLLRLIAKHALGLQDVLEQGLASTPTRPWKAIIPQLFSRLNHHEPYVRKRVSELLCRVAESSSHLIVFPSVVGTGQKLPVDIADISISTNPDDSDDFVKSDPEAGSNMTFCFNSLLDTLSKQSPQTVSQVQILVRELRRITLLWDEIWTVSLTYLYGETAKKIASFNTEVLQAKEQEDFEEKLDIFADKYKLLMRPFHFVFEHLIEMTSRPPETNNERTFQEKFLKVFQKLSAEFMSPFDPEHPMAGWQKFKAVYHQMQQRAQRRSAFMLKMSDISPILANLRNTEISMPGRQYNSQNDVVYIKAFDESVVILPTKTKPKKLIFYGSDGKKYAYLFKGLEDLHLDERIMQFLSIANLIMTDSIDCNGNVTRYRALNYSVIPLGPRSGLISWVDGVVPIFALYKKWQQREAANPRKNTTFVVKRPSEMYYEKLTPLLESAGLKTTDQRKDWPLPVLKQVLSDLQKETPRDLLAKELWCHSTNASEWRAVIKNYSLSIAVMSVIGYVIGLGDRHLDNMLINLASGEVLHIDYNVCFEKGKTLRVPEKVPFRMTPNLEEALGVTGIEGIFRLSCEHVLDSLKRGRETLLTLLEAFVYDPLVDWAIGDDMAGGLAITTTYNCTEAKNDLRAASKTLEREVTRDTLAIKFTEIKPEWTQNKSDIKTNLLEMDENLRQLTEKRFSLTTLQEKVRNTQQQIALVGELEKLSPQFESHPLASVSQRYAIFKKYKDEFDATSKAIETRIASYEQLFQAYKTCSWDAISNPELSTPIANPVLENEFEIVKDFLLNSNQKSIFDSGVGLVKELEAMTEMQLLPLVQSGCELVRKYSEICHFLPASDYHNYYCTPMHLNWLQNVNESRNVEACEKIKLNYHQHISEVLDQAQGRAHIFSFACQLQQLQVESNGKIQMYFEELKRSQDDVAHYKEIEKAMKAADKRNLRIAIQGMMFSTVRKTLMLEQNNTSVDVEMYCEFVLTLTMLLGGKLTPTVKFLKAVKQVYAALDGLHDIFYTQIIPSTLRGIFSGDQSVLGMIADISSLFNEASKCGSDPESIARISTKHENLLKLHEESGTDGGQLLLEINSLFDDLDLVLRDTFKQLPSHKHQQVDVVQQAMQILKCPNAEELRRKSDAFFVVRLKAIVDFFTTCLQYACGLKGTMGQAFATERLCEPILHFITAYTWQFLLGAASYGISLVLCETLGDLNGTTKDPDEVVGLEERCRPAAGEKVARGFEKAWTQKRHVSRLERSAKRENKNLEMLQLIASAHFWLHEHILVTQPGFLGLCPISRAGILIKLQGVIDSLKMVTAALERPRESLRATTGTVLQRLKWAVGANPSLNDLANNFTAAAGKRKQKLERHQQLGGICLSYAVAMWTFEIARLRTPEGLEKDSEVLGLISSFENTCAVVQRYANYLTPLEESLVRISDPQGPITPAWIAAVLPVLRRQATETQNRIAEEEREVSYFQDKVSNFAHTVRVLMNNHHRIKQEIWMHLKAIVKFRNCQDQAMRDYWIQYKEFLDVTQDVCTNILSKDFTEQMLQTSAQQLKMLLAIIDYVFDEIFVLDYDKIVFNAEEDRQQPKDVVKFGNPKVSSHREQKRNAYAVSVWRRIRMKLEGRDRDPNRKCTVHEQVDWIINEAMNADNLAVLYEGWTPWV